MMEHFAEERRLMVQDQISVRGIKDKNVIDAMLKVPRHIFAGKSNLNRAYSDSALPIGSGQTISQPYMVAVMTEALELKPTDRVLEIGTGSGYQGAVLAEIVREVYTIERIEELFTVTKEKFSECGYTNIHTKLDDGTLGWPEEAPFDKIMITASAPNIPHGLIDQLSENGGIILAPVGPRITQQLHKITKNNDKLIEEYSVYCVFVPLIGKYGWNE